MVAKKGTRRGGKKLRVKKETLRDLETSGRGKNVKTGRAGGGGGGGGSGDFCTVGCNLSIFKCLPTR